MLSRKGFSQPRAAQVEEKKEEPVVEVKPEVKPEPKKEPVKVKEVKQEVKKVKEVKEVKEAKQPVKKAGKATLREQFAFVLYACAKETTRKYKMMLRDTGLTYTQYIAMLALWDTDNLNVKTLGEQLYLDSGTLTPMLHKMEDAGFIVRKRNFDDERNLIVSLTEKGKELKKTMIEVEEKIQKELPVSKAEAEQLLVTLGKMLEGF